jgi:hypothetical protein
MPFDGFRNYDDPGIAGQESLTVWAKETRRNAAAITAMIVIGFVMGALISGVLLNENLLAALGIVR